MGDNSTVMVALLPGFGMEHWKDEVATCCYAGEFQAELCKCC